MSCSCNEFSRAAALRRSIAEAGRGLPTIEPGMPVPAGSGLDRRSFLTRAAGLALSVYGAGKLPLGLFEEGIARAQGAPPGPVLVSVFLDGGADSLAMLFPAGHPQYASLRPQLALAPDAGQAFAEDTSLRWHPSLAPLAELHAEGKLTVLPAIGYTNADQSHFTSRHYWEVGATDAHLRTGWLGRYLDAAGTLDNPLQGLALSHSLHPSLASANVPVAAVSAVDDYGFWARNVWGQVEQRMLDALGTFPPVPDPAASKVAEVTQQAATLRGQLRPFEGGDWGTVVPYPTGQDRFPSRLAGLAAMIAAGLPLRCVTVTAPGMYDTHADQANGLSTALDLTARSLRSFQRDLESRGIADRVLVLVWSEFGRRAGQNGSAGTDHGAAGIGLLMGSRVRGQMLGEFPGLTSSGLDHHGNLKATFDYRSLYSSLLEQWFATDAAAVIPNAAGFARAQLLT
ncbi:MAG TPA: DUF1501 domain-containing protein [Gaiellaceae bacterium]|nr:DUF1501 domain-containing protein [Gaiellaceae bacterium]